MLALCLILLVTYYAVNYMLAGAYTVAILQYAVTMDVSSKALALTDTVCEYIRGYTFVITEHFHAWFSIWIIGWLEA